MSIVSVELIPEPDLIEKDIHILSNELPNIKTINIPDLPDRFSCRSWKAAGLHCVSGNNFNCIPHIRASDCDSDKPLPFISEIRNSGISEILVVTGDPLKTFKKQYNTTIFDVLYRVRNELPNIKVYAALDQYRSNMFDEVNYARQKIGAGFDGLFTQPFFSTSLLLSYHEMLNDVNVFWGLCPVVTDASKSYWEKRNKTVFPNNFRVSMDWNIGFGKDFMSLIKGKNFNAYIMPIRVPLKEYVVELFR